MSQKLSLLDNSSDSETELSNLTINTDYANKYSQWRKLEELQKYKDLKKDEEDSESSSESEEEFEEEFDEEFFRALSLLKGKDPRLYDKSFQLFKEKHVAKKTKVEKEKPIYMKDYERNLVLERGGKFSDEDEEENVPEKIPTYSEEQENLRKSFKEAVGGSDDSDSDADDLLQVRTKTKKEEEEEEADYVKWLKGEEKEISEDVKQDMSYLRNYWNDPKLDEGEKFLRDYILNKRYLEKDDSEIPTYEEITSGMLSDDEKMIEEQEKFEHKYNFRFEEPDEEFIKRYPRTISDSLRRVDNRRKQKREDKAERKRKERELRREELKRLKALKRKEIEEKFMKLKEISGQDEINLNESDIESDFDPDKHDQKMREMFNDEYYQVEEEKKPEFPYDEELDSENWNAWAGEKIVEENDDENETDNDEHEDNQNESNINPKDDFANEMINASQPKKKVRKKSLFAKIISQPKPIYDPDGKSFEDYLDEYYKLDYEDIVGDMPVRYKYRKVIPNDFGLTVEEILAADDRELNRWCSVKKTCQFRNEDEELYDVQAFQKKAQIPHIKQKCLPSVYAPKNEDDSAVIDNKNTRVFNKKIKNDDDSAKAQSKNVAQYAEVEHASQAVDQNLDSSVEIKQKKNKSKKKYNKINLPISENNESLDCSQSSKSEHNGYNLENIACDEIDNEQNVSEPTDQIKKSSKKKNKNKQNISRIKSEWENSNGESKDLSESTDINESTILIEGDHKSHKRKRKQSDNSTVVSNFDSDVASAESPMSKQRCLIGTNDTISNSAIETSLSDAPSKKKKKKKKKSVGNSNESNMQQNTLNHGHNRSKDKHKKWTSEDKRLGLSDERLAAYGINPKKFKNKIIYSKK